MKTCKNPDCTVPVNEQKFHKKSSSPDGLSSVCTHCKAEKDRIYREQNKESIKLAKREYRRTNLEKVKKANKTYYESNKEKIAEKTKEYRENNKEYLKEQKAEYYRSFVGRLVSKNARSTRRALKNSTSDGTVTKNYLDTLLTIQNNKCYYCENLLDLSANGNVHLDHYIPLSKGGKHSCGNVVWSCSTCNLKKGTILPEIPLVFKIPSRSNK